MNDEISVELDLRNTAQVLFQNRNFDLELMFVLGVLVMTASAGLKVWATRLNAMRRRLDNSVGTGSGKSALLLQQRGFNLLALQRKRHEHGFAPAMLIGRQAGQAIAAINQLFDGEEQRMI